MSVKEGDLVILGGNTCILRPEIGLRFIERDGQRVLQQRWLAEHTDHNGYVFTQHEWRDVPFESD